MDDYSHITREYEFFHPHSEDDCCCDECEFCHETSVLDALHENSAINSNAHGFASVVGFLFGIK